MEKTLAKQFIKYYKGTGRKRDTSKPVPLVRKERVLSKKTKPAGKDTCNAKLQSRDGYCKQHGVIEFARCKQHGGKKTLEAYNVFSKSLGFENALKMQAFIEDTLSMDNELASSKVMLTSTLEDWQRAHMVKTEYMEHFPMIPDLEEYSKEDKEIYKKALDLHQRMLAIAEKTEQQSYVRAERLTKVLVDGIAKNKKLTEGAKFTMDIKQVRDILKIQLEVMAANCSGCDRLKDVIGMMKKKAQDIMVDPGLSKESRKAMGSKKYAEELGKIESIRTHLQDAEFDEVDE